MAATNYYSASKNPDVIYGTSKKKQMSPEEKTEALRTLNQLKAKRKKINFEEGEEVYVETYDKQLGYGYIKSYYVGVIGCNIYLKRPAGCRKDCYITESFRIIDAEYGLVKLLTSKQCKERKREKLLEEIDKWVKLK